MKAVSGLGLLGEVLWRQRPSFGVPFVPLRPQGARGKATAVHCHLPEKGL